MHMDIGSKSPTALGGSPHAFFPLVRARNSFPHESVLEAQLIVFSLVIWQKIGAMLVHMGTCGWGARTRIDCRLCGC